jgi:hypothetical protein
MNSTLAPQHDLEIRWSIAHHDADHIAFAQALF